MLNVDVYAKVVEELRSMFDKKQEIEILNTLDSFNRIKVFHDHNIFWFGRSYRPHRIRMHLGLDVTLKWHLIQDFIMIFGNLYSNDEFTKMFNNPGWMCYDLPRTRVSRLLYVYCTGNYGAEKGKQK